MAKKLKRNEEVEVKKTKVVTEATPKKTKKKEVKAFSLEDISDELGKFESDIYSEDREEVEPCYIIPFKNEAMQFATGGILGGKFHEISGDSQSGKSYILYDLYRSVQEMGGVCYHQDGERALTDAIMKSVKIKKNGTLAITYERDINKYFAKIIAFIKAVRKKNKKCPILIGCDSFPSLQTTLALENFDKGKDPKGYAAMQKNAAFSQAIEKLIPVLDDYDATFILINQLRWKKDGMIFGDNSYTLAEDVIKFWCTQRIRGKHVSKLKTIKKVEGQKNPVKLEVGMTVEWYANKNRFVAPFQKVKVQTLFSKGLLPYSGIADVLQLHERISIKKDKESTTFIHNKSKQKFSSIVELIDTFPEVVTPIKVGELDDSELVEENDSADTNDFDNEVA